MRHSYMILVTDVQYVGLQLLLGCAKFQRLQFSCTDDCAAYNNTRAVQPVATCRQSLYLHKPAIVIVTLFSL